MSRPEDDRLGLFLVWSWEHEAWWGPARCGYVREIGRAGRYSWDEAADITVGHIPPGEEVAVHEHWASHRGRPPAYGAQQP